MPTDPVNLKNGIKSEWSGNGCFTAGPTQAEIIDKLAAGVATPIAAAIDVGGGGGTGVTLSNSAPPAVAAAGSAGGGGTTTASKSDHTHAHGDQAGGTLHAVVSGLANGFMSVAQLAQLNAATSDISSTSSSLDVLAATVTALAAANTGDVSVGAGGLANGLTMTIGQIINLAAATEIANGALDKSDKVKLNALQFISVTDPLFGAGTGGDDTAKIQDCLDYANENEIPVILFPRPPAGRYTIDCDFADDNQGRIFPYTGQRLMGYGLNVTIFDLVNVNTGHGADGCNIFEYDSTQQDIVFTGLTFQSDNDFTYWFQNQNACIYGRGVGAKDVVVRDCHFRNIHGFTVHSEGHIRTHIFDCTSVKCANGTNVNGDWCILARNAFEMAEGLECSGKHIVIMTNTFKQVLGNACSVGGNQDPGSEWPGAIVVGNSVDGSTSVGMTATDGCVVAIFANNSIRGCEDGGFVAATGGEGFILKNNILAANIFDSNCKAVSPSSIVGCDIRGGQGGWLVYSNMFIDRAVDGYDQRIAFHLNVPNCVVSGNYFLGTFKDASFDTGATNTTEELNVFVNKNEEWYGTRAPKRNSFPDCSTPVFINRIWNSSAGDDYGMFAMYPDGELQHGPNTVVDVGLRDSKIKRIDIGKYEITNYLNVRKGIRPNSSNTALPTAGSTYRGQIWFIEGASGFADVAYVCRKKADDTYEWQAL